MSETIHWGQGERPRYTQNGADARLKIKRGPLMFPSTKKHGPKSLERRPVTKEGFGTMRRFYKLLSEVYDVNSIFGDIRLGESDIPSDREKLRGLTTPSAGRSVYLIIGSDQSPIWNAFPQVKGIRLTEEQNNAMMSLVKEIEKLTQMKFPHGVLVKIKGNGPSSSAIMLYGDPEIPIWDPRYYRNKQSLPGFTGFDWQDVAWAKHVRSRNILPSRELVMLFPLKSIREIAKEDIPNNSLKEITTVVEDIPRWDEPLYLEVFLEYGGLCITDLAMLRREGYSDIDMIRYAEWVLSHYGFTSKEYRSIQERKRDIFEFMVDRYAAEAREAAYFQGSEDNRTDQNLTLAGFQDWDTISNFHSMNTQQKGLNYWRRYETIVNASFQAFSIFEKEHESFYRDFLNNYLNRQKISSEQFIYLIFLSMHWRNTKLYNSGGKFLEQILERYNYSNNSDKDSSAVFSTIATVAQSIGGEEASRILTMLLDREDLGTNSSGVFCAIATATESIGAEEASRILTMLLDREDLGTNSSGVFCAIATATESIGAEEASRILTMLLDREDLGANTTSVLSTISAVARNIDNEGMIRVLTTLLDRKDLGLYPSFVFSAIVINAEDIGGKYGSLILNKLLDREDLDMHDSYMFSRIAAAAGTIRGPEGGFVLSKLLDREDLGDDSSHVFSAIAAAAGTIRGPEGGFVLSKLLDRKDLRMNPSYVLSIIATAADNIGGEEGDRIRKKILKWM